MSDVSLIVWIVGSEIVILINVGIWINTLNKKIDKIMKNLKIKENDEDEIEG
ncbi:MAG: hypothetical protein H7836_11415 [Magnetococcus sp. YQC-3]